MGAEVLEFHFTDTREGKEFRDHKVSLVPSEVKLLIDEIFGIGTKVIPQKCSKPPSQPQQSLASITPLAVSTTPPKEDMQEKVVNKVKEIFADEITQINIYKKTNSI